MATAEDLNPMNFVFHACRNDRAEDMRALVLLYMNTVWYKTDACKNMFLLSVQISACMQNILNLAYMFRQSELQKSLKSLKRELETWQIIGSSEHDDLGVFIWCAHY